MRRYSRLSPKERAGRRLDPTAPLDWRLTDPRHVTPAELLLAGQEAQRQARMMIVEYYRELSLLHPPRVRAYWLDRLEQAQALQYRAGRWIATATEALFMIERMQKR